MKNNASHIVGNLNAAKSLNCLSLILSYGFPLFLFWALVGFYFGTYDFIQIKSSLTFIGASLLLFVWVLKLFFGGEINFQKSDIYWLAPFLCFLTWGAISSSMAAYPANTLAHLSQRFLFVGLVFFIVMEFNAQQDRVRLWAFVFAASLVVQAYGLIQYFDWRLFPGVPGLDPFSWRQMFHPYRISSTFGNANYYGNFLLYISLMFFVWAGLKVRSNRSITACLFLTILFIFVFDKLTLGLFGGVPANKNWFFLGLLLTVVGGVVLAWIKKGSKNTLILLSLGLLLINIYASGAKSSWIGICVSFLSFLWLGSRVFLRDPKKLKQVHFLMCGIGIFCFLLVGYFLFAHQNTSLSFRKFTWISSWSLIKERPIQGFGLDSFRDLYPAVRKPEIILIEGKSNTQTSHAENEYIELWQNEGIIGLGLFLWICILVLFSGYKKIIGFRLARPPPLTSSSISFPPYKDAPIFWETLVAWSTLLGILVQAFLDVSLRQLPSNMMMMILFAVIISNSNEKGHLFSFRKKSHYPKWLTIVLFGLIFIVTFSLKLRLVPSEFFPHGFPPTLQYLASALMISTLSLAVLMLVKFFLNLENVDECKPTMKISKRNKFSLLPLAILLILIGFNSRREYLADVFLKWGFDFSRAGILTQTPENDVKIQSAPSFVQYIYNKWGGSLELYSQSLKMDSHHYLAAYYAGELLMRKAAELAYQSKVSLEKKDKEMALSHLAQSDNYLENLEKMSPHFAQLKYFQGMSNYQKGKLEFLFNNENKADQFYRKAYQNFISYQKIDPVYLKAYEAMLEILLSYLQYEDALQLIDTGLFYHEKRAKELWGENYQNHIETARLKILKGQMLVWLAEKETPDPYNPPKNRVTEALQEYQEAKNFDPKNKEVQYLINTLSSRIRRGQVKAKP